jgi:hypothetical protein
MSGLGMGWVERPVERLQGLELGHASLFEAAGQQSVAAAVELVLDEQIQEIDVGQVVVNGFLIAGR